jgi:hypothetical protein
MARGDDARVDLGVALAEQRHKGRRERAVGLVGGAGDDQHARSAEIGHRRSVEHRHRPQERRLPDQAGMKQHQAGHDIGAVRIAKEGRALQAESMLPRCFRRELGKGGCLGMDAGLLETGRRDSLEPAKSVLLADAAARCDDH